MPGERVRYPFADRVARRLRRPTGGTRPTRKMASSVTGGGSRPPGRTANGPGSAAQHGPATATRMAVRRWSGGRWSREGVERHRWGSPCVDTPDAEAARYSPCKRRAGAEELRSFQTGTLDPEAADAAWDAAAAARRIVEKVPPDPSRVMLPAGTLATAEATVRAVLAEHGAPASEVLTLADVRLAGELLRVQQRANAIAAQEAEYRLRLRMRGGRSGRQAHPRRARREHHPRHLAIRPSGGRPGSTRNAAGLTGPLPG